MSTCKTKNHISGNMETTALYDAVSNVGVLRALSLGEWDKWRDCKLGNGEGGGVSIDDVNYLIQEAIETLPEQTDWSSDIISGDDKTLAESKAYTYDAIKHIPTYDWNIDIRQGDMDTLLNANLQADQKIKSSEMTQYSIIMHDSKSYTDAEIAKIPVGGEGKDWQSIIDFGDKNTKQAAENYTDSQSTWVLTEAGNQISNGLASASIYTDQEITKAKTYTDDEIAAVKVDYKLIAARTLTESKAYTDVRITEANHYAEVQAGQAWVDSKDYVNQELANQMNYVNSGDAQTLAQANAYTDSKVASGLSSLKETVEAYTDSTNLAFRRGSLTTTANTTDRNVLLVANDPETARSVLELGKTADLNDGLFQHVMNCTGNPESSVWSSSLRVHLSQEDYDLGYKMYGPKGAVSNSIVMLPGSTMTIVLDKVNKKWWYSGINLEVSDSKVASAKNDAP